ncbi:hypothetical protein [Streptomyces longisporoflavus]|uniref:Uncharacterized protein n=1 Tax=Streptomyces longisporoflavus TaxID=28044 RepID=A0ABW7QWD0_9ACTN
MARRALTAENPPGPPLPLYRPEHPRCPVRMRRYRTAGGWTVIGDGSSGASFPYRFPLSGP